jgi:hypothetical protein
VEKKHEKEKGRALFVCVCTDILCIQLLVDAKYKLLIIMLGV